MIHNKDIKHREDFSVSTTGVIDVEYFSRRNATDLRFIANQPFDENNLRIYLDEMPLKEILGNDV